jgi:hypothetical protein
LVFIIIYAYDSYIDDQKYTHNPINMGSYEIADYYKIDPNTILEALNRGEANVFLPLQGDPFTAEEFPNVNISWTQADYLQIANALSQFVWGEPLDFKDWKVYDLHFRISCQSTGFDYGEITYFRPYVVKLRRGYTTRHIEIDPYSGIVRWGDKESYPQPILFNKWNDFDLSASKITAESAVQIANDNGGKEVRLRDENKCYITMSAPASHANNKNDRWRVSFVSLAGSHSLEIYIDPYTGEYEIQKPNE